MELGKKNVAIVILIIFIVTLPDYAVSISDTAESRLKAAKRYLQVISMRKMVKDGINEMAQKVHQEKRDEFIRHMNSVIRVEFLEKLTLDSMVKIFTAEELNALADFYGSDVGKSVMGKFGVFMGEVIPALQQELSRALQKLQQEGKLQ